MSDVPNAGLDAAQNAIVAEGTTYYVNFNTGDPGQSGADESDETRQAITFGSSSDGTQTSTDAQTWTDAHGGTYTYFSVWSAATDGTYIRGGSLTASISPPAGSTIEIATGGVTFTAS